ncbi:hypothetical protein SAMN04488072_11912 [Lentibacillus halodurans]|uniref:Uncharacterized protein n=1 Tax=Lentibacillus halodurans TaxID=237679 RepID=A0A1I1AF45_9BACI|nr:hypothetical protein [Lentibacillus halodurans]SFB35996.1 hypothetical protein SAMN04488072_11912 [Lentibacillus halodurans]
MIVYAIVPFLLVEQKKSHPANYYEDITGRSTKGNSTNNWPGTIDDTVSQIEAYGGKGIAVRCDHTNDSETEAVITQIRKEQEKLEILINNVQMRNIGIT